MPISSPSTTTQSQPSRQRADSVGSFFCPRVRRDSSALVTIPVTGYDGQRIDMTLKITATPKPKDSTEALFNLQKLIAALDEREDNPKLDASIQALKRVSSIIDHTTVPQEHKSQVVTDSYWLLVDTAWAAGIDLLHPETLETYAAKFAQRDDHDDLLASEQGLLPGGCYAPLLLLQG